MLVQKMHLFAFVMLVNYELLSERDILNNQVASWTE